MAKTVTISYLDDRLSGISDESECVDLVSTMISERVLDLRDKHIRQLSVAVAEVAPAE